MEKFNIEKDIAACESHGPGAPAPAPPHPPPGPKGGWYSCGLRVPPLFGGPEATAQRRAGRAAPGRPAAARRAVDVATATAWHGGGQGAGARLTAGAAPSRPEGTLPCPPGVPLATGPRRAACRGRRHADSLPRAAAGSASHVGTDGAGATLYRAPRWPPD